MLIHRAKKTPNYRHSKTVNSSNQTLKDNKKIPTQSRAGITHNYHTTTNGKTRIKTQKERSKQWQEIENSPTAKAQ